MKKNFKRRDFLKKAGIAGAAATAVSSFPAPAIAADRVDIAIVTTWPRDFPGLGTGAQRFGQRLADMSDGRFSVEYFAAGERVGAFDSFDEVASGNAQMYHAADYYWKHRHPGWSYFSTVPFGLVCNEINAWINFGGGQTLWDELAEKYGLKCLPCGNTGVQMGGWFRNEIRSHTDFQGLKIRIPGLGGEVMAKLGAIPISLNGGEIYQKLISGNIDATEWFGPWNDSYLKLYEAAKYYYYPGMHEPSLMLSLGINKSWWENLSNSDQITIKAAAHMENNLMISEYNKNNSFYLNKMILEHGVLLKIFDKEIIEKFAEASNEVFDETRQHSDLANRIHESFLKARNNVGSWLNIADQEFIKQRNSALGIF